MKYTEKLNQFLANLTLLYTKQHNLHWFVKGKGFFVLHSKIEELYDETSQQIDDVAERLLQLNQMPVSSLKAALELADIKELDSQYVDGEKAMELIVADFKKLLADSKEIIELAGAAGDEVTVDQFVGYAKNYEKSIWLVTQYLM